MSEPSVAMVLTRLEMWINHSAMDHHMLLPLLKDAHKCIADQQREIEGLNRILIHNDMYRSEG